MRGHSYSPHYTHTQDYTIKNNTAKHSTDTTITTAEKYFGSIQSFPVTRQAKRYLACLGKAYDLREMFTRAIKADNTAPLDCSSEVFDPLDVVISVLEDHYLHYSLICNLPNEHTFAEMSNESKKGGAQ